MTRRLIGLKFLRPENPAVITCCIELQRDLPKTLEVAGVDVANVSESFRSLYQNFWRPKPERITQTIVNRGTLRRPMPKDWINAFQFCGNLPLIMFLTAVARQGNGREGDLLVNGTINGCVLREAPDWSMTARWHDPDRPYGQQTSVFLKRGWSLHVVTTASGGWCPQGSIIMFY